LKKIGIFRRRHGTLSSIFLETDNPAQIEKTLYKGDHANAKYIDTAKFIKRRFDTKAIMSFRYFSWK
jgi:hypothetical protein